MPVVLHVAKGRKKLFDEVSKDTAFKGISMATLYTLAAVYGFLSKKKEKTSSNEWVTRYEYVSRDTQLLRTCQAIGVAEAGDLNILKDEGELFVLISGFASAGIVDLHKKITSKSEADYGVQLLSELDKIMS